MLCPHTPESDTETVTTCALCARPIKRDRVRWRLARPEELTAATATYTYSQVLAAISTAADDVDTALHGDDERETDLINLIVNAALARLKGETDLDNIVAEAYGGEAVIVDGELRFNASDLRAQNQRLWRAEVQRLLGAPLAETAEEVPWNSLWHYGVTPEEAMEQAKLHAEVARGDRPKPDCYELPVQELAVGMWTRDGKRILSVKRISGTGWEYQVQDHQANPETEDDVVVRHEEEDCPVALSMPTGRDDVIDGRDRPGAVWCPGCPACSPEVEQQAYRHKLAVRLRVAAKQRAVTGEHDQALETLAWEAVELLTAR